LLLNYVLLLQEMLLQHLSNEGFLLNWYVKCTQLITNLALEVQLTWNLLIQKSVWLDVLKLQLIGVFILPRYLTIDYLLWLHHEFGSLVWICVVHLLNLGNCTMDFINNSTAHLSERLQIKVINAYLILFILFSSYTQLPV